MAAWAVSFLCAIIILKPQEFIEGLSGLPIVHLAYAAVIVCIGLDLLRQRIRPAFSPQIGLVLAFFAWGLLVTAFRRPDSVAPVASSLGILLALFVAIAVAAASPRGVRLLAITLAGCALLVTLVAIQQHHHAFECAVAERDDWMGKGDMVPDGRPCETAADCREDAPDPMANYRCERPGPLGTTTVSGGRVRYRGSLADPNELSLLIALATPFLLFMTPGPLSNASFRSFCRLLALGSTGVMGYAVVLSRSRSGVIAFLVVLGLSAVRAFGAWGIALACLVGPMLVIAGGRSGAEAELSSEERMDLLRDALILIRRTTGTGVGIGGFPEESSTGLTAHNAYMMAAAETGLVGLFLFGLMLYASFKVPVAIGLGKRGPEEPLRRLSTTILISLCCTLVGIFFLSWAYKDILFMLLGLSAALSGAARGQNPGFEGKLSLREITFVCLGMMGILGAVFVMTRHWG